MTLLDLAFDPAEARDDRGRWTADGVSERQPGYAQRAPAVVKNGEPFGLAAEARKAASFEQFEHDYLGDLKHGLYDHVTADPHFTIDPTKGPRDWSSMSGSDTPDAGKLMVTSDPAYWAEEYRGDRHHIALIDMTDVPRSAYKQVNRGMGNEFWVSDPSKARVLAVLPVKQALAAEDRHQAALPNSEEALRAFYEKATGRKAEPRKDLAFDPAEARDEHGRWSAGQAGSAGNGVPAMRLSATRNAVEMLTKMGVAPRVIAKRMLHGLPEAKNGYQVRIGVDDEPGRTSAVSVDIEGGMVTLCERTIRVDEDGLHATHNSLLLQESQQGAGVGMQLLKNSFDLYREMAQGKPVSVSLWAADVGAYAWARAGFVLKDRSDAAPLAESIKAKLDDMRSRQTIPDAAYEKLSGVLAPIASGKSDDPAFIWKIADARLGPRKIGRELLADLGWGGEFRLDNAEQMSRFNRYAATRLSGQHLAADWVEDEHPRDGSGKFAIKDGTTDVEVHRHEDGGATIYAPVWVGHEIADGSLSLHPRAGYLQSEVAVVPNVIQRRGVATRLYDSAVAYARSTGAKGVISVPSSRSAQANALWDSFRRAGRVTSVDIGKEGKPFLVDRLSAAENATEPSGAQHV